MPGWTQPCQGDTSSVQEAMAGPLSPLSFHRLFYKAELLQTDLSFLC